MSDGEIYGGDPKKWTPGHEKKPLDYLREQAQAAGGRIYLFEMKFFHAGVIGMKFEDFVHTLFEEGFRWFIVLKRRNFLRKVISSRIAFQSRTWHLPKEERVKHTRLTLDPDNVPIDLMSQPLVAFLQSYQRDFEKLDALLAGRLVLRLTYEEDIQDDPLVAYGRVCDFLGIERRPAVVRYGKTTPFPLKEILVNYAEIDRSLAGTPFHWMLED